MFDLLLVWPSMMAHHMLDDWWLPPDIGPDGEPLDDDASTLVPGLAPSTVMDEPADVANLAEFQDGSEDNDSCISLPPDVLTANDEDAEMYGRASPKRVSVQDSATQVWTHCL